MDREEMGRLHLESTDKVTAIEEIMDMYGTPVKRFLFSYVKDWDTAGDLAQEVFLTVYEKLADFQGRSSFKTWVYSIAANKAKDYLKSWHYRNMVLGEKLFSLNRDSGKTPEDQVVENEVNRGILEIIHLLPVKYREVFLLHYYQDLSISEIAAALGIPPSTVKTRLYRGKDRAQKLFRNKEEGGELHG